MHTDCVVIQPPLVPDPLRFMDTHEDWIYEIKLAHLREQLQVGVD